MERALIIGDTGGIGSQVRETLEARGVEVVGLSRSRDGVDLCDEGAIASALATLHGTFDLVFVATGALEVSGSTPEKSLKDVHSQALLDQFLVNAVGPALILKHAPRLLPSGRRSVFAALSARVGSIGDNRLGGWYGYRASKAALNQILRSASIELNRTHRQAIVVALHPGTVATRFTENYRDRHPTVSPEMSAHNLLKVVDGLGASDTGKFYDWAGTEIPW